MKTLIVDSTFERDNMISNGMKMILEGDLIIKLDKLGYRLCDDLEFTYINDYNYSRKWKAKACYIVEKDSGLSFANVTARKDDNFKELQKLRRTYFVFENNTIWEL